MVYALAVELAGGHVVGMELSGVANGTQERLQEVHVMHAGPGAGGFRDTSCYVSSTTNVSRLGMQT